MGEVKENIFRYPIDIRKRHTKSLIKNVLLMVMIWVLSCYFFYCLLAHLQNQPIMFDLEMMLAMVLVPIVFWLVLGTFSYLVNILLVRSLRNTEIVLTEDALTRRIKDKEETMNWNNVLKVEIYGNPSGKKTISILGADRTSISILSDIERIDELISLIKKKLSPSIIIEKKHPLLGYVLGGIIGLIFGGLWFYAIAYDVHRLESILIIILWGFFLFILLKFGMFSSTYGSKGKWIDRILIVWFIYALIRSIAKLIM